jgi:hypothetical protein
MEVNPVTLIAGLIAVPVVGNAIGRTFIQPKENLQTEQEANAELRRLMKNFAIFNGLMAAGLGYLAARGDVGERWQGAALGGAIGTGLLATMMAGALVTGPSVAPTPIGALPARPLGGVALPRTAPQTLASMFILPSTRR